MCNIQRLNEAYEYLRDNGKVHTKKDLAEAMGANRVNISRAFNGDEKYLTKSFLIRLNNTFGDIFNTGWLLGEDNDIMLRTGKNDEASKNQLEESVDMPQSNGVTIDSIEKYEKAKELGLPLLPETNFKFAGGQTQLVRNSEDITRYWYLPDCRDCEGVAQVIGRSMSPTLPSGSWVALKKYTIPIDNPNMIPFGNIFGVVVEDEDTGEYHGHIKILRRYKDKDMSSKYWIAHSINEEEFDDFDIKIAQVRALWIVKQHIVSDIL